MGLEGQMEIFLTINVSVIDDGASAIARISRPAHHAIVTLEVRIAFESLW